METSSSFIHKGESISSRVYETLRSLSVGETFTVQKLAKRLNINKPYGAISAFLSIHTHTGMYEIVGMQGRAIAYRMIDSSIKLRFRVAPGIGGKVGRKFLSSTKNLHEAKALNKSSAMVNSLSVVAVPRPLNTFSTLADRLMAIAIELEAARSSLSSYTNAELLTELAKRSDEKRM